MRWELLVAAAAMAVCASSCGKRTSALTQRDDAGPAAGAQPPQAPRSVLLDRAFRDRAFGDALVVPVVDRVELIHPGETPRRTHRYRVAGPAGHTFTATTEVETRELSGGRWTERVAVAPVRIGVALDYPARAAIDSPRVNARVLTAEIGEGSEQGRRAAAQQIARYRAVLEGRRATVAADIRGLPGAIDVTRRSPDEVTEPAAAELATLLAQSVVPFPDEPIGPGARWEVTMMLRRGDAVVKQTASYALVSVDGPRLAIDAHVAQVGEHQIAGTDGLPEGVTSELVALFWETRGTVTVDPSVLTPIEGALSVELRVHGKLIHPRETFEHFTESMGTVKLATSPTRTSP